MLEGAPGDADAPAWNQLVAEDGTTWARFRRDLKPRYARAWLGAAGTAVALFSGLAGHMFASSSWGAVIGISTAPLAAAWIGFWLHALNQFAHEGAHGHLASNRYLNDALSDWLLWTFFGQSVHVYRASHMQHHRLLGDVRDTEIAYYEALDPMFLLQGILGIRLLVLIYEKILHRGDSDSGSRPRDSIARRRKILAVARSAVMHGVILAVAWQWGGFASAFAWAFGLVAFYPLFGTLRPLLEHRSYDADSGADYRQVPHGPVNRLFGNDLFSRCFGAAGTNKHLLHHWDPGISYTRFGDMERFLLRTPFAARVEENRTTYLEAFRRLAHH